MAAINFPQVGLGEQPIDSSQPGFEDAHSGIHGGHSGQPWENAAQNIRVNTLAPGQTDTPIVVANSAQNPAFAKLDGSAIPARHGAEPSEVAAAAVWLCSAEASYVFSQMLVVDGGMTIGGFECL